LLDRTCVLIYLLIQSIDCAVIAVDAKDHMHRRQLLAGMIVSDTRLVTVLASNAHFCANNAEVYFLRVF